MNKLSIVIFFFTCFSSFLHASDKALSDTQKPSKQTPKNNNTTTGFMQEFTEIRIHEGKNRTGKEIYEHRCKACHAKNTQGAPMPNDQFEWSMRIKNKGIKLMLKNAMEGFSNSLMPPKGGCRDCNQEEVYAAVFYMLKRSGVKYKIVNNSDEKNKKLNR